MKFYKKNYNLTLIKLLFYIFPIIMMMASGYITFYVSILTILSIAFFIKYKYKIILFFSDYIVLIFFLFSFIVTFLNYKSNDHIIIIKSFFDLRFALLYLVIRNIIYYKIVEFKKITLVTLFAVIFLSFDIFIQNIYGKDIFGYEPFGERYNGIFEHEAIAGSYIQKFSLIGLSIFFIKNWNVKNKIIYFLTSIIFALAILFTLDRMPFIIYLASLSFIIIFSKNYRFFFTLNLLTIIILFLFFINTNDSLRKRYERLSSEFQFIKLLTIKNNVQTNHTPLTSKETSIISNEIKTNLFGYSKLYIGAYNVIINNNFLGSGVKSFEKRCLDIYENNKSIGCSTHPHNLYLEIIINIGFLGFLFFLIFIFNIIYKVSKQFKVCETQNKIIIVTFLTIIICEVFPLRSYGSIFQTVNGSIFWYLISLASSISTLLFKKSLRFKNFI
jgi:O-antigen ligase